MIRKLLAASVLIIVIASIVVGCTFVTTNTASATAASLTLTSTAKTPQTAPTPNSASEAGPFVGSINSDVYHYPWCSYVDRIKPANLVTFNTAAEAQAAGYRPCSVCNPP